MGNRTTCSLLTRSKQLDKPGTYFRCIGFLDEKHGFAGNIGPNYFPGITDTTPLYETRDGGETWTELPLINDASVREFGIAFADEKWGWVGGLQTSFQTTDGGKSWAPVTLGTAVNKIRLLKTPTGLVGYAIGVELYKLVSIKDKGAP